MIFVASETKNKSPSNFLETRREPGGRRDMSGLGSQRARIFRRGTLRRKKMLVLVRLG